MRLRAKPITEPNGSQTLYWLLFPEGNIFQPVACLTDYDMQELVDAYLQHHELEVIKDKQ